jgi:fumarate reductase flavoprotein subunit
VDLAIVGGGVAGWVAACRAQELGQRVAVLEADPEYVSGGNGRLSGGWYHAAYRTPDWPQRLLYDEIVRATGTTASPEVARAWVSNVNRAFEYLKRLGATFGPVNDGVLLYQQNVLQPTTYGQKLGRDWLTGAPFALFTRAHQRFTAGGGHFVGGFRAAELIVAGGQIAGVRSDRGEEVTSRAVLLCDGGFQGNPDLVRKYITAAYKLRGSASDRGDALLMGQAAGAAVTDLRPFYGHVLSRDSLTDDRLWPAPGLAGLIDQGIVLAPDGRRFVDERLGDVLVANQLAWSPYPDAAWLVVTVPTWRSAGAQGTIPPNPTLADCGATVITVPDAAALSDCLGMPRDAVARSVDWLPDPEVPSGLVAVPVVAGITFTMGGLQVDGSARVLRDDGGPHPGALCGRRHDGRAPGRPVRWLCRRLVRGRDLRAARRGGCRAPGQPRAVRSPMTAWPPC